MRRLLQSKKWFALRWLLPVGVCLIISAGCAGIRHDTARQPVNPDWILKATKRLTTNDLWKEHNGGANIYIERGCLLETMSDYRHRNRPWMIRCSVFDQSKPEGARSLFKYYYDAIENEVRQNEPIGDATYLSKSPAMRAWVLGFCKGRFFVEVSLVEQGGGESPQGDEARRALLDFARRLAATL